jgi:hypothetical protein
MRFGRHREGIAEFQLPVDFIRDSVNSKVMLLVPSRKQTILIAFAICLGLLDSSCMWSSETSFFSNFSMRHLSNKANLLPD